RIGLDPASQRRAARDLSGLPADHRVGGSIGFGLRGVAGRGDLELVLPGWRGAVLLHCVSDLVSEQVLARRARRIVVTSGKVALLARRVGFGTDGAGGSSRFSAGVDPDRGQIGAERGFEFALQWLG